MRKDSMYNNKRPTQGFNMSGGFGDCKKKSTHFLGASKINAHGLPIPNTLLGRYMKLVISVIAAFDRVMRFIIDPRACRNQQEINVESSLFLWITMGLIFVGVHWSILILWPILIFCNALRYNIIGLLTSD